MIKDENPQFYDIALDAINQDEQTDKSLLSKRLVLLAESAGDCNNTEAELLLFGLSLIIHSESATKDVLKAVFPILTNFMISMIIHSMEDGKADSNDLFEFLLETKSETEAYAFMSIIRDEFPNLF
jgi:hypothetical protein